MKRILLYILIMLFCIPLVGCLEPKTEDSSEEESKNMAQWTDAKDGTVTEKHLEMFEKALSGVVGVSYTPTKLIATQVVAGVNYKFLCEEIVLAGEEIKTNKYVVIYRDFTGNCSIVSVEDVEEQLPVLDGWTTASNEAITEKHTAMFNEALKGYTGASFKPIKLVATQIVAGVNYKFLCEETITGVTVSTSEIYVTIYQDLEGNCSIVDIE